MRQADTVNRIMPASDIIVAVARYIDIKRLDRTTPGVINLAHDQLRFLLGVNSVEDSAGEIWKLLYRHHIVELTAKQVQALETIRL